MLAAEVEQVRRFKVLNINRQHEPFYRAYPECMKGRLGLPDADYERFGLFYRSIHNPFAYSTQSENRTNVDAYLNDFRNTGQSCFTLWEHTTAQALLDLY
jgi:hypothetical protein